VSRPNSPESDNGLYRYAASDLLRSVHVSVAVGYYLEALIATLPTLEQHALEFRHARVVPLACGVAIIPITDDLYDEVANGGEVDRFSKLSPGIEQWAQHMSAIAPVTYIEAEFFGGVGGQGAVAWSLASRVLGPIHSKDAINQALRFLGVQTGEAYDEFEAVGLGRHRTTDDWIEPNR